jgi:hypothetical protein
MDTALQARWVPVPNVVVPVPGVRRSETPGSTQRVESHPVLTGMLATPVELRAAAAGPNVGAVPLAAAAARHSKLSLEV